MAVEAAEAEPSGVITDRDRLDVLRQYRTRIGNLLTGGDFPAALAVLFDLDEEWGRQFERRLVTLSTDFAGFLSPGGEDGDTKDEVDRSKFRRQAERILDAIERSALDGIYENQEPRAEAPTGLALDLAQGDAPGGGETLSQIKKRVQGKSLGTIEPLVRLTGIGHRYRRDRHRFRLKDIDQEFRQGEITAIVGSNGTGKTTLMRIIAADLAASEGEVSFPGLLGSDAPGSRSRKIDWVKVRRQIAFVPSKLDSPHQKVMTFMQMTGLAYGLTFRESTRRTQALLHRYGLADFTDAYVSGLSSGYRLRFELARIMLVNPPLIVLDEPLAHLDIQAQSVLLSDLRSLASSVQQPRAIVVSSHHIRAIEAICDQQIILSKEGRIATGPSEDAPVSVFRIGTGNPTEVADLARALGANGTKHGEDGTVLFFDREIPANDVVKAMLERDMDVGLFQNLTGSAEINILLDQASFGKDNGGPV